MLRLVIRPQANYDLVEIALRIAEHNVPAGERFFDAFEDTCNLLLTVPTMGSPCQVKDPTLQGLRVVTITGYRNHVILYRSHTEQVEIVRVVHGSRDLDAVVDEID